MDLLSNKNIFVVAAHPDDEILGCGGTMAKAISQGASISILLLGEGPTSRENEESAHSHAKESAHQAAKAFGITNLFFGNLPDNRFDSIPLLDIVKIIEEHADNVRPDIVLTHHCGDLNIDHSLTHRATITAFRPLPECKPICIAGFEIPSSTEYTPPNTLPAFRPNIYVDISNFLEQKKTALKAYASEMRPWPHPRSNQAIDHLAHLRGSQAGVTAAECFSLYRAIT